MLPKTSTVSTFSWDRIGIGVSGICAIHCLAFPVFLSTFPLWGFTEFIHDWLHPLFIVTLILVIYFATKRNRDNRPVTAILLAGFILIALGWVIDHFWGFELFESSVTLSGSALLVTEHPKGHILFRPVFERGSSPNAIDHIPDEEWVECIPCVESSRN
ncbi:MAG: MerC domain-containing protein [Balneolaceae bacterium]